MKLEQLKDVKFEECIIEDAGFEKCGSVFMLDRSFGFKGHNFRKIMLPKISEDQKDYVYIYEIDGEHYNGKSLTVTDNRGVTDITQDHIIGFINRIIEESDEDKKNKKINEFHKIIESIDY